MNVNPDRSKQIEEQDKRINDVLKKIKHSIVVFSGKGGVGKTTVAVNLAYAFVKQNRQVGLLDADITGPNVPQMTSKIKNVEYLIGYEGNAFAFTGNVEKAVSPQEQ